MTKTPAAKRILWIDFLRGLTVVSMVFYHAMWDAVFSYGADVSWFRDTPGYIWQQSICWTFILLSGFCWSLDHHPLKRGLLVSAAGILVTAVTAAVVPKQKILFGILTLLGACILLMIVLRPLLEKIKSWAGLAGSFFLFLLTRNCAEGSLGFGTVKLLELPRFLYRNLATAFLGFYPKGFASTDYFPLIPWLFLYAAGYFLYRIWKEKEITFDIPWLKAPLVYAVGRNALLVYLLHQPVITLVFEAARRIKK